MDNRAYSWQSVGRYLSRIVAVVCIASAGVGCASSPGVNVTYDNAADFGKYQTYSWTNGRIVGVAELGYNPQRADTAIRKHVNKELIADGLQNAIGGGGDLNVTYQVIAETKVAVTYVNEPYPVRSGRGVYHDPAVSMGYGQPMATEYESGTLIVEISDANDGGLVWRGSATRTINPDATPAQREQRIAEVIAQMFNAFPPQ